MSSSFRAFSVANLASPAILPEHTEPWLTAPAIPAFDSRESYKKWMADSTSIVPLFSLIEAENPMQRVNSANPPHKVHGLVTDYDSPLSDAEVARGLARIPASFPAFAWNRTRRGGIRVVWRFESPVFYYGDETFKLFTKRVAKELRLTSLFPGLDEEILAKPDQCYAAGDKWTVNGAAVIPSATLELWLFEILKKTRDFERMEIEIPLEIVKAEVDRLFPGRWKGDFREGSRGIRFWDPTADNETAALVRKNGMTAFTGDKSFLPWSEILGGAFVAKFKEDTIGRAAADLWCDNEKNYYRKLPDGNWDLCGVEVTRRHLKGRYGLSDSVRRGEMLSDVDAVLLHLELNRRVEGALPFPHRPEPVVEWGGRRYLNTATNVSLMKPRAEPAQWQTDFPFLADYLSTLFIDEKNLEIVLAWLKVYYRSCHEGFPRRGQALFIVGPPGTGKTFFSLVVLASIFGGYADARMYFVEGARFNSSMFDSSIWSLDDSTILGDRKMHQKFSGLVKACVANPAMAYEKKYGYSGSVPFNGRFICTMNDDPVSLGILPDTDQSLLDKVILARTDNVEAQVTGDARINLEKVQAELPAFLRWLLDWELPAHITLDHRFGIKAWHDSHILEEAQSVSESKTVMEAVEIWLNDFTPSVPGEPWIGNATQLLGAMRANDVVASVVGRMSPVHLGRQVNAAIASGSCPWIKRGSIGRGEERRNVYFITKPKHST